MKYFLFSVILSHSLLLMADATTRSSSNEAEGTSCMVSSTYGYGCETGSGCLTPDNASQVTKPEEPSQKAE